MGKTKTNRIPEEEHSKQTIKLFNYVSFSEE